MIPCTKYTRNNPGCRCVKCVADRARLKAAKKRAQQIEWLRQRLTRRRTKRDVL